MNNQEYEGFCTSCRFKIKSFKGLWECPNCHSNGIPCSYKDQVTISINWHELHLLCVWAENYGRKIESQGIIYAIAHDLEAQFPDKNKLTLAAEVNEIKKEFPGATFTDKDGKDIPT